VRFMPFSSVFTIGVCMECKDASPEMSVSNMVKLIDTAPPGPWPEGWATWKNVHEAHHVLLERYCSTLIPSRKVWSRERGVVIAGGGLRYLPSVWVGVNILRDTGCTLPVQLWYLGEVECDPFISRLLEPLGVELIDARKIAANHPTRILCGWELKIFATLYSDFEEVLFMDADNAPTTNVEYLWDHPRYKEAGSVFWPDYPCWELKADVWSILGIPKMVSKARGERAFESGQYLINKSKCARELQLALWYAEHSDFVFRHVYGDKECFHLAWRKLETEYAMPTEGPGWNEHTIVQYDLDGKIIFQHRCQDKWRLGGVGNKRVASLANEDKAFQYAEELGKFWNGVLWSNPWPTSEEQLEMIKLQQQTFVYRRVGYDERTLTLGAENWVSQGKAACEERWWLNIQNNQPILTLSRIDRPTCHLRKKEDGVWVGRWLEHERMPVELIPC